MALRSWVLLERPRRYFLLGIWGNADCLWITGYFVPSFCFFLGGGGWESWNSHDHENWRWHRSQSRGLPLERCHVTLGYPKVQNVFNRSQVVLKETSRPELWVIWKDSGSCNQIPLLKSENITLTFDITSWVVTNQTRCLLLLQWYHGNFGYPPRCHPPQEISHW